MQHNKTGRIYVGSSENPAVRCKGHLSALRNNHHMSANMQKDFNMYGEDYSYFILDTINDHSERVKEYEWIQKLDTTNPDVGYNKKDAFRLKYEIPFSDGLPTPNDTKEESNKDERN